MNFPLDNVNKTSHPGPPPSPKQMHFLPTLIASILSASSLVSAGHGRNYERKAAKNLVVKNCEIAACDNGWYPLPRKASLSQCSLALLRIVKQPQSCPQQYMSSAARAVYLPIYNWFISEPGLLNANLEQVAIQFSRDNSVGVRIYDAFAKVIVDIGTDSTANILPADPSNLVFQLGRTWALNYATFLRDEPNEIASISQNVYSVEGELLTIEIYKELSLLPVVC